MQEARRYHTVVSLHINMYDAYKNSPSLGDVLSEKHHPEGRDCCAYQRASL
jgi:hypothetical protein